MPLSNFVHQDSSSVLNTMHPKSQRQCLVNQRRMQRVMNQHHVQHDIDPSRIGIVELQVVQEFDSPTCLYYYIVIWRSLREMIRREMQKRHISKCCRSRYLQTLELNGSIPKFAMHNDSSIVTSGADKAFPKVVCCSIAMPHEETTSNAESTKLLLPCNDDWSVDTATMLDVADMAAREVDNEEVECIDGLPRRDKDSRDNDEVESIDGLLRRDKDIR